MLEKLKEQAIRQGFKLIANPKVMKMMADPRVIGAITQGFALKGRIQSEIDHKLRWVANQLNLATKEDLEHLRFTLNQMESSLDYLEKRIVK